MIEKLVAAVWVKETLGFIIVLSFITSAGTFTIRQLMVVIILFKRCNSNAPPPYFIFSNCT